MNDSRLSQLGLSQGIARLILSPDKLSTEERSKVSELLKLSAPVPDQAGVLIGFLRGQEPWDLRPLVLETAPPRGSLSIVRLSPPNASPDKIMLLEKTTLAFRSLDAMVSFRSAGKANGQIWLRRSFFPMSLSDFVSESTKANNATTPWKFELAGRLIQMVATLQKHSLIHGHVSTNNTMILNREPILVDFGFASASATHNAANQSIAPEISAGRPSSSASDVYGLSFILEEVLKDTLSHEQLEVLISCRQQESSRRPSLSMIETALQLKPIGGEITPRGPRLFGSRATAPKVGRLIPQTGAKKGVISSTEATNTSPAAKKLQQDAPREPLEALPLDNRMGTNADVQQVHTDQDQPRPRTTTLKDNIDLERSPTRHTTPHEQASNEELKKERPTHGELHGVLPSWLRALLFFTIAFATAIGLLMKYGDPNLFSSTEELGEQYQAAWQSGQPSKMLTVARDAVENGNQIAQSIITASILSGAKHELVRNDIARIAFNAKWEAQLSPADRRLALGLSLVKLMNSDTQSLPPLDNSHPGVALAIAGDISIRAKKGLFSSVPLSRMEKLPEPYGPAFKILHDSGIDVLDHPVARSLAHIMCGSLSDEIIQTFLLYNASESISEERLRFILLPFSVMHDQIPDATIVALQKVENYFSQRVSWFTDQNAGADWNKVAALARLSLMAGITPVSALGFEQLIDLLSYPALSVRKEARDELTAHHNLLTEDKTVMRFAVGETRISRIQIVMLLSAFHLPSDQEGPFLSVWFKTNPNPELVFAILLDRANVKGLDEFNIDAAQYLAKTEWNASDEELESLTKHVEPLARALAFSRLDANNPTERAILQAWASSETTPRIKEQIELKLKKNGASEDAPS